MRVLGLPAGFYTAVKRPDPDVPSEARTRALMVAWVDERRPRGVTRDHACRMLVISPRSYTRWRSILRRDGVRALADHRAPTRKRDPWKRREYREAVERVRRCHPCGKDKLAILNRTGFGGGSSLPREGREMRLKYDQETKERANGVEQSASRPYGNRRRCSIRPPSP